MKLITFLIFGLFYCNAYSQSATFSEFYHIKPSEACKYIGEWHEVNGNIFKVEIKKYKPKLDSAVLVLHMTDDNRSDIDFIILTKVNIKRDINFLNLLKKDELNKPKNRVNDIYVAEGKIFLYRHHPALHIRFDELRLIINEPVD